MGKIIDLVGDSSKNVIVSDRDPESNDKGVLWYNSTNKTMLFNTPNGWETKTITFSNKGTWNAQDAYNVNDIAAYNNGVYIALQPNTNKQPDTNPDIWSLWFSLPNVDTLETIRNETKLYRDEAQAIEINAQALKDDVTATYINTESLLSNLNSLASALQQVGTNFFEIDSNSHLIANFSDPIKNVYINQEKHLILEY